MTLPNKEHTKEGERPTVDEYFGDAGPQFRAALTALHEFAQASNCKPGGDVVGWFGGALTAFQVAQLDEQFGEPSATKGTKTP